MQQTKLTDEEYEARLCAGYNVGSMKELVESDVMKNALKANGGDFGNALRSLEVKREHFPALRGWFVAKVADWNYQKQTRTGKTIVTVWTEQGDIIEHRTTQAIPEWDPLKQTIEIGPVTRNTYLLKDENDPKRVIIEYKNANVRAVAHDAKMPERVEPGALKAIEEASSFKAKGRKVLRLKAQDVHFRGTITDDPTQIKYSSGDYGESLAVVVRASDGAVVQMNFKADSVYSPDHVASVFGIQKDEEAFREVLLGAQIFARGQLGISMPYDPAGREDSGFTYADVERAISALRDAGFIVKETNKNTGEVRERLSFKDKYVTDENGVPTIDEKGQKVPLRSVVVCGREVYDIEEERDADGNPAWKLSVLMTDQPGKYPWFSASPGKPSERNPERPPNNAGAFVIFLDKQLEAGTVARDDMAARIAARYAKLSGA